MRGGGMFRGEILIGQFVGVAGVKDVCVIESAHGGINRFAALLSRVIGDEIYERRGNA